MYIHRSTGLGKGEHTLKYTFYIHFQYSLDGVNPPPSNQSMTRMRMAPKLVILTVCILLSLICQSQAQGYIDDAGYKRNSFKPWNNAFLRQQRQQNHNFFRSTKRSEIPLGENEMDELVRRRLAAILR